VLLLEGPDLDRVAVANQLEQASFAELSADHSDRHCSVGTITA
jgi:hypothetical protein